MGKFFRKKSRNGEKTDRGTLWSRPVLYDTRETFLVQLPEPTGVIKNFVELLVELFWSLQVYRKKTDKSHDYSRLVSRKAPTKQRGNSH